MYRDSHWILASNLILKTSTCTEIDGTEAQAYIKVKVSKVIISMFSCILSLIKHSSFLSENDMKNSPLWPTCAFWARSLISPANVRQTFLLPAMPRPFMCGYAYDFFTRCCGVFQPCFSRGQSAKRLLNWCDSFYHFYCEYVPTKMVLMRLSRTGRFT